jgi:chromosome segregation ATPase
MFNWKSRERSETTAKDDELLVLRRTFDYLQNRATANGSDEPAVDSPHTKESEPAQPQSCEPAQPQACEPAQPQNGETDDSFVGAQRFIAEQRTAAEALLREISALDDRFKIHAEAAQASRNYAAAKEVADGAATAARQANEVGQAAAADHQASAAELKSAEELLAASRADAQTAESQVADLERRLREALQSVEETASTLATCEARAKECAQCELVARSKASEAAEHAAACNAALETAQLDAATAKDRSDTLKSELQASGASLAGITDVQSIAARIAQAASSLNARSLMEAELIATA